MYVWKWTNDKQTKRFVQTKLIKYTILLLYHLSLSYPPPLYCLNPCRIQCCTYWIVPFLNFDSFVVHPNRSLDLTSRSLGCSGCTTISNRDQPPNQSLSSNKQFIQNNKLLQWNNVFKYILFFHQSHSSAYLYDALSQHCSMVVEKMTKHVIWTSLLNISLNEKPQQIDGMFQSECFNWSWQWRPPQVGVLQIW